MTTTGNLHEQPTAPPLCARTIDAHAVQDRRFPRTTATVSKVRAWVRATLTAAAIDTECIEIAVLLTSEVVTNAVLHTDSDDLLITLTVGSYIEVGVQDQNTAQNTQAALAPRPVGISDTDGRGLHLVHALATEWGTRIGGTSKIVWFRIAVAT